MKCKTICNSLSVRPVCVQAPTVYLLHIFLNLNVTFTYSMMSWPQIVTFKIKTI